MTESICKKIKKWFLGLSGPVAIMVVLYPLLIVANLIHVLFFMNK